MQKTQKCYLTKINQKLGIYFSLNNLPSSELTDDLLYRRFLHGKVPTRLRISCAPFVESKSMRSHQTVILKVQSNEDSKRGK